MNPTPLSRPHDRLPADTPSRERIAELRAATTRLFPVVHHPDEVADRIRKFETLSDSELLTVLRQNLLTEDPVTTVALHADELVERTLHVADLLVKNANLSARCAESESNAAKQKRVAYIQSLAGAERRRSQDIVNGLRARQGRVSNAPNARARAARELARLHPEEFVRLVRKHEKAIIDERRAAKLEARAARRAQRLT